MELWLSIPEPDLLVVATRLGYLNSVLQRVRSKVPPSSAWIRSWPELKPIETDAVCWAARHYRTTSEGGPPGFSMALRQHDKNDRKALGWSIAITSKSNESPRLYYVSPGLTAGKVASDVATYLSGKTDHLKILPPTYRIDCSSSDDQSIVALYVLAILGHVIFI